jgi:hypothetical protein
VRSLSLVALLFSVALVASACGTTARCDPQSCFGCCDSNGACVSGDSPFACGALGGACSACRGGETCTLGRCFSSTNTGGSGGSTGGGGGATTGGGGGATTGGGGGATTGGGGGATTCSSATCAGCCTGGGVCITTFTPSRCGLGGQACTSCNSGNTCVNGACTPCAGCIDINTGACTSGASSSQCGRNGGFCQACDTQAGQSCQSGVCQGGTMCNASTCPQGCCDGSRCVQASQFTTAQCGQGTGGAACVSCVGGAFCNTTSRQCEGGGGGTDGGPVFPDGGFDTCTLFGTPCTASQCCDVDLTFGFIPTCYDVGATCFTGTCRSDNVCR